MVDIRSQIEEDVAWASRLYGEGGTPYFDFLDSILTSESYFKHLYNSIMDAGKPDAVVASGKFGWAFSMYCAWRPLRVFNFPGDLRHQPLIDPYVDPPFKDREFVFVDNSIYKGRTLSQINGYVNLYGGTIKSAMVLYDGTRPPHGPTEIVTPFYYLYRWHDGGFRP